MRRDKSSRRDDRRAPATSAPELWRLDESSRLDDLTDDWLELAGRLDGSSYFQTPDWVLSWWETLADRPQTSVAAWRAPSGRLDALAALSRDSEPLHPRLPLRVPVYVNAGSGAGAADHCGWLVGHGRREEVGAWVSGAIGHGGLLLRGADPGFDPPPMPAGARVVEEITCPRLSLAGAPHDAGCSPDFGRQLRRFTRGLEREGVVFEWVPPGTVDEGVLTALFDLHRRSRARHGAESAFDLAQFAFHAALTRRSQPGRGPAAVVARIDDSIVGVLYGFWWKDVFAAYQSGWDTRFARSSMGSVLIHQAIRLAAEHGARTFDFLRGAEAYKYRFGAVDRFDRTWLVPRGPAGRVLAARQWARERRSALRGVAAVGASPVRAFERHGDGRA